MWWLERLLIVSFDLAERATGRSLDEAASEEEIKEAIFYDSKSRQGDAVTLWGLCSAFHNTFAGNRQKEVIVKLVKETILLISLEKSGTVVAIARLSRTETNDRDGSQLSTATARRCIERSHALFCLLRGGGIEQRMDDRASLQRLFALHKAARQQDAVSVEALEDYRAQLSLTQLRNELAVHYDTFLTEPMTDGNDFHLCPPVQFLPAKKSETRRDGDSNEQLRQLLTHAQALDDNIVAFSVVVSDDRSLLHHITNNDHALERLLTDNRASVLLEHLLHVRASTLVAQQQQQLGNYFVVVPAATTSATALQTMRTGFLTAPPLAQLSALDTCAEEIAIATAGTTETADDTVADDHEKETDEDDTAPSCDFAWAPRVHVGDRPLRVLLYNTNLMVFVTEDCASIDNPTIVSTIEEASVLAVASSLTSNDAAAMDGGDSVDCTLLPQQNVWIYRSSKASTTSTVLDAGTYKTVGAVETAMTGGQ